MKSIIVYLYFVVMLSACSTLKEISGNYSSRQIPYSIILNKDSTFYYRYKFEFDYEYSHGRWNEISKKKVVLNSNIRNKTLPLLVLPGNNINRNEDINLNIITPDFDRKHYECLIFVNGALHAKKRCDSIISISVMKPVENIFLGFTADRTVDPFLATRGLDTLYTEKFNLNPAPFDKYTLRISYNDSLFNFRIFDNEIFKIGKRGLIFYDYMRKIKQTIPRREF